MSKTNYFGSLGISVVQLDALSMFPWGCRAPRFEEMLGVVVRAKADAQGCFTPESVYTYWRAWDFWSKEVPLALVIFFVFGSRRG